jgi:hypothetical protein
MKNPHSGNEMVLDGRNIYYDHETGHHFTFDGSALGVWKLDDPDDKGQRPDPLPPPPPLIPQGTTPDDLREALRILRIMKGGA